MRFSCSILLSTFTSDVYFILVTALTRARIKVSVLYIKSFNLKVFWIPLSLKLSMKYSGTTLPQNPRGPSDRLNTFIQITSWWNSCNRRRNEVILIDCVYNIRNFSWCSYILRWDIYELMKIGEIQITLFYSQSEKIRTNFERTSLWIFDGKWSYCSWNNCFYSK